MVAMFGLDHARALGDAHDAAVAHRLPADLGVKVGGHDPLGRGQHRAGGQRARPRRGSASSIGSTGSRQPITPVDAGSTCSAGMPRAAAGGRAQALGGGHAVGRADVGDLVVHQHGAQGGLAAGAAGRSAPARPRWRCG